MKRSFIFVSCASATLFNYGSAYAEPVAQDVPATAVAAAPVTPAVPQLTPAQTQAVVANAKAEADKPGGINDQAILNQYFGAGIMANIGSRNHVKSAHVVNNVVRIDEENRSQLGFMLEAHKFLSPSLTSRSVNGPFIGLVMDGENASIDTGILGWMWGFRRPNTTSTLNIGLGASISPHAQILGDGIVADKPLPTGETEVRFKKVTLYGIAFVASFGF